MTITLGLCVLGVVGAILAGVRHGAATPGLALLFAGVALRQGLLLHGGVSDATPFAAAGELAILCGVTGALLALRSQHRTTRERDRAEDLHWDSMEAVRAISELAARPGADLPDKLRTVLELGAARFDLGVGVAWREGGGADGELLALRAPAAEAEPGEAWRTELLPRLCEAARATRPVVLPGGGDHSVMFAAPFAAGGERGALAFAGSRRRADRFTATDKDLLGLMAMWLGGELERRTRAEAPAPSLEPPVQPATRRLPPRRERGRDRDLNRAVRRAERGLRRRVGADATLEVALAGDLPPVASGRLPLASLVESLVLAAARLAPTGRIRVETSQLADAGAASPVAGGDVMLSASVEGDVDPAALERIFARPDAEGPGGALSLAGIERMLRRDGADLSVAVEPGRRALLTAYLRAADPAAEPVAARARSRATAADPDQPSR